MVSSIDLITLDEAKATLNLSGTTAYDGELPLWITGVSQRLDKLIGPVVRRTVTNELHDGGYHTIYLRYYPIFAVTTVTEYNLTVPLVLSPESNAVKPPDGYQSERYLPDPTLYSQRLRRRYGNVSGMFAPGRQNVVVTYQAGRVDNTASVEERFKVAAGIMLESAWRSQEIGTAHVGEFDVPSATFPKFAIPRFVKDMFPNELQEPRILMA